MLLEVVFSNTAEQSDGDPKSISFRGIDNKTYYLTDEAGAQVVPDYGAPNAFNCNHPVVHTLVRIAEETSSPQKTCNALQKTFQVLGLGFRV